MFILVERINRKVKNMETLVKFVGAAVIALGLIAIVAAIMAIPTMFLVNYLFSDTTLNTVFGVPFFDFWKALWLNILCGLLFKTSVTTKESS